MTTLRERLAQGEVVLMDGGMGTELERRGVPMHGEVWSGAANLTHPDVVRTAHEDFIRAGAEIIITNTFATGPYALRTAGLGEQVREANLRAVALAREAARNAAGGGQVYVAGSITTALALERDDLPSEEEARASYREQAELLAEGGVDFVALEMLMDLEHAVYATEAALGTGLPVWAGISCQADADGNVSLYRTGQSLPNLLDRLVPLGLSGVAVMHSEVRDTPSALRAIRQQWSGPLGAYPHHGKFIMPHWQFGELSPEDFARQALSWIDLGTQVVGGCCGTGPEHTRALRDTLPRVAGQARGG